MVMALLALLLLQGCAAVGPAAGVIGAGATVAGTWHHWSAPENVSIIPKECLFLQPHVLSPQTIAAMPRDDLNWYLEVKRGWQDNCKSK